MMNPSACETDRRTVASATGSATETRRSLVERLKDAGDDRSWEEFVGRYRGVIDGLVRMRGVPAGDVDEVVQETLVALVRGLPRFVYDPTRCRFKNWIRAIAERRVADHFRRQRRRMGLASRTPEPELPEDGTAAEVGIGAGAGAGGGDAWELPDERQLPPDAAWDAAWQEKLLDLALRRVRDEVKPAAFRIYHELVVRQRTPSEVARLFQVSLPGVYLARHRVGVLVRRRFRELERDPVPSRSPAPGFRNGPAVEVR